MIRTVIAVLALLAAMYFIGQAGLKKDASPQPATDGTGTTATEVAFANANTSAAAAAQAEPGAKYTKEPEMKIDPNKKYIATMETTEGTIKIELLPKIAPRHVNSFVFLSREGFYNDVPFHRVIKGFMIQGGDPTGTGTGGPGYRLPAEFNPMKHERGVLSAARAQDPNSAGSQFFLMHGTAPHLDNQYTAYGKVIEGIEVVDKIANLPTGRGDRPVNVPKIKTITIEEK